GLTVSWWDNQSGCKGACDRVDQVDLSHRQDPDLCRDAEAAAAQLAHDIAMETDVTAAQGTQTVARTVDVV
ncbi:hypothetical protein R0G64_31750, partial [Pseudomonas otitidis]|nr:hypothetical protein [Pseudomonas otitidis]